MAKNDKGLTPMMRQFFSMKAQHPDALMLFRCGDFYETYCDDAIEAAKILGITLTRRNNGAAAGDEMAGFPHHALDTFLPKLIRAGKRVAICDQLEDPKKKREQLKGKKGLTAEDKMVRRGITELVTPGVAMGDSVLNYKENNFLAAVHLVRDRVVSASLTSPLVSSLLVKERSIMWKNLSETSPQRRSFMTERGRMTLKSSSEHASVLSKWTTGCSPIRRHGRSF